MADAPRRGVFGGWQSGSRVSAPLTSTVCRRCEAGGPPPKPPEGERAAAAPSVGPSVGGPYGSLRPTWSARCVMSSEKAGESSWSACESATRAAAAEAAQRGAVRRVQRPTRLALPCGPSRCRPPAASPRQPHLIQYQQRALVHLEAAGADHLRQPACSERRARRAHPGPPCDPQGESGPLAGKARFPIAACGRNCKAAPALHRSGALAARPSHPACPRPAAAPAPLTALPPGAWGWRHR